MFRCYFYLKMPGFAQPVACRTTEHMETMKAANDAYAEIEKLPNFTGGGIEQHIRGIGWTILNEDEDPEEAAQNAIETAQIGNARRFIEDV